MNGALDAHVREIKAGVDEVTALIKARVPDAGPAVCGDILDAYGSSTWSPSRSSAFDFSAWGAWEAWEHCAVDASGPVDRGPRPSGEWIAWDSASGGTLGFPGPNAAHKAEMFAVLQNAGKATRVVSADGSFRASALDFARVNAKVEERICADVPAHVIGDA